MNVHAILEKLGLNKKQVDIYLVCLEYGPLSMTELTRLSGYKRSTLYNIVEDLLRNDFIILIRRNKRTLYDAEKPKKLLTALRARERELENLLPDLERIRTKKQSLPNVDVFESETAVLHAYDEAYDFFNNKHEVCFFTSVEDIYKNSPVVLENYLAKFHNGKDYKLRELIYNNEEGRRYIRLVRDKGIKHPVRLLPPEFPIHNDLVLYGSKVLIASFKHRITATVFDNPETTTTLKTLFEWAWTHGKDVD